MWRRLFRVALPVVVITLIVGTISCLIFLEIEQKYQQRANQEITGLVGVVVSGGGTAEIVANLRHPSSEQVSAGAELLRQYGYFPSDFASPSAQKLFWQALLLVLLTLIISALLTIGYFSWRDWRRDQQIAKLIEYMQHLSERIYDLRLNENSEDELSILSNELYKVMVLLREAADSSEKAQKQLETALADISHQLRTPLTSMQIMVDNIYDDPKMPVAVRQDFLRSISRQVESMSNLVTTLLNLAKFDNGSIHLQRLPVKAGELLTEVRQKLEVLAELCGVTIAVEGDTKAQARLDRRWQVEALTNIVKNCLEHSQPGGKVTITVINSSLFLRFKIQDNGEGIAAKDLRHIFERFYKAQNSHAESVGIGLAFAKAIIEADHGQINVKSAEGKGTTFTVTYFH